MEGEESILSIANFLEATKPANKEEQATDNLKVTKQSDTPVGIKVDATVNVQMKTSDIDETNLSKMDQKPVVKRSEFTKLKASLVLPKSIEPINSKITHPVKSKPEPDLDKLSATLSKSAKDTGKDLNIGLKPNQPSPGVETCVNVTSKTSSAEVKKPEESMSEVSKTTKPVSTNPTINPSPNLPRLPASLPCKISLVPVSSPHIQDKQSLPVTKSVNPTSLTVNNTPSQTSLPARITSIFTSASPAGETSTLTEPSSTIATELPTKPVARTKQGSLPPCPATLLVSTLSSLTTQLNNNSPLHNTSLKYLSPDSLRNLCDGVQALDLSGETDCSDTETLTLYWTVLNIQISTSELSTWSTKAFLPFTNLACRTVHCHHLQRLVYKEPNLKGIILTKVGQEDFNQFDQLTDFYMKRGDLFICENTGMVIYLYHRIRNLSLEYVLNKLHNVYLKMKPIFKQTSTDPVYNTSVTNLTRLMNSPWDEQVALSEEHAYDFDFLITILMYWKKAKDNPVKTTPTETVKVIQTKLSTSETPAQELQENPLVFSPPSTPAPATPISVNQKNQPTPNTRPSFCDSSTSASVSIKTQSSTTREVTSTQLSSLTKPVKGIESQKIIESQKVIESQKLTRGEVEPKQLTLHVVNTKIETKSKTEENIPYVQHVYSSEVSVFTLHQLKTYLDQNSEPMVRVVKGVGQQAYREFNNLVSSLQDMSMVIVDINVKTLYFTIRNFAYHPVTPEMRKYEPLSNFSLKYEPFHDLKVLLLKDVNIRKIVNNQLGMELVDKFLAQVDKLGKIGSDFVMLDQESNIVLYHKFRNCVIDNLMARLKVVHSKIQVVQLINPPDSFTISVKMLQSLMATHYNGQVLMMEKSKFDFDFLTTILEFLQQYKDTVDIKDVKVPGKPADILETLAPTINSIVIDIADIGLVQSIESIVGADICKEYIAAVKGIGSKVENLDLKQKKAIFSLKNSIFFFKNNFKCEDLPLTNISLEANKFSYLFKFIGKDAGIKTAINEKHGEVALKELEALVAAHDERGNQFISKFVEKNVKLYHALRNTALEKILRQISVVHGKVKNIDLPQTAKNSTQYHIAIKKLDTIVYSDFTRKILVIEDDLKFEFDFLSTILLVWRTETTKQAEISLKAEEAKHLTEVENKRSAESYASKSKSSPTAVRLTKEREARKTIQIPAQRRPRTNSMGDDKRYFDDPGVPDDPDNDLNDPDFEPDSGFNSLEDNYSAKVDVLPMVPTQIRSSTLVLHSKALNSPQLQPMSRPERTTVTPVRSLPSPLQKAQVVPATPNLTPQIQTPRPVSAKIATSSNPMPVSPGGGGELPIKTKCTLCPDKTAENVEQLVHHYSFMHFREEIEQSYIRKGDQCVACKEKFKLKFNLIKHLGLVHGAVQVEVSQTERWICNFCKKEFLSDEFLRKHLIKTHLEKKFESSFLAFSETNEILCQFCDKTFSYKKNLFCHIGIDHDKLGEVLPNYNHSDNSEDDMKCRHCDLELNLSGLKLHYLTTHYKQSFTNLCKEENLVQGDLVCRYCLITFSDEETLVLHIGMEHNKVYRLISHFQGKNVSIVKNPNPALKAIADKISSETSKNGFDEIDVSAVDPLITDTVFIDTEKDIQTPTKPLIKIVSPTKLLSRQTSNLIKSSNIVSNQSMGNNNFSPKIKESKGQRSSSPKADPKLKRQDTSKWCNICNKNFLASKYEAHIILKHLNQLAVSELKTAQSLVSCHGLQCPDNSCTQAKRFINIESLLVHFITKHSQLLQSKHAESIISKDTENANTNVENKANIPKNVDICLDISNDSTDQPLTKKSIEPPSVSPWVEKFKTFCSISAIPEARSMISSKFQTMSPIVLDKFLTQLCQTSSTIPKLEEVISDLSVICPKNPINNLPTVVRHLLLLDYKKHCNTVGVGMQVCNPMQVVIMLSQLLAKPKVNPEDLEWLVRWVSKMHDKVEGRRMVENKKIIDFFDAVGYELKEPSPVDNVRLQVKQEPIENVSFACEKCGTKFNKRIGLVRHRDRCGEGQGGGGQILKGCDDNKHVVSQKVENLKVESTMKMKELTQVEDSKQVAAEFKAKRLSLGLTQKQVLVNMKNMLGQQVKVQTIDLAKFELNHSQQSMAKFLPLALAWLKGQNKSHSTSNLPNYDASILTHSTQGSGQAQVKSEPAIPSGQPEAASLNVQSTSPTEVSTVVPRVDIVKLKVSPTDFTSSINLTSSLEIVQEPKEREKIASTSIIEVNPVIESKSVATEIVEAEPECIDLDEEDKVYRYFCLECEGCAGSPSCDHTSHPRVPLLFDISTHIARTGHVGVSPITGFLSLSPLTDLAYSLQHGADVRKQWKDLVLAGSYIPSQFTGVKKCKWATCQEVFEDAVEAFKHIRDIHLKPKQMKPLQQQLVNSALKRKSLPPSNNSVPPKKISKMGISS